MYNNRNDRYNEFDPNMFVPGLSVYIDAAEGLIALFSRIGGFLKSLTYGVIAK